MRYIIDKTVIIYDIGDLHEIATIQDIQEIFKLDGQLWRFFAFKAMTLNINDLDVIKRVIETFFPVTPDYNENYCI